jgi:cell division protein FtsA
MDARGAGDVAPVGRASLLAAVDLGTSKVLALLAEGTAGGEIRVLGVGTAPARGMRRGVVVDLAAAADAVGVAVERCQRMAGRPLPPVVLGIAGGTLDAFNHRAGVAVARPEEVGPEDVAAALAAGRSVALPPEREVVHAIPRHFILDGYEGVRDPLGLAGSRLEVETHVVTAPAAVLRNAVRCAERAGLSVADVTLNALASAEAVTAPGERDLGVAVADIGAGCTDVVVLQGGAPVFTAVAPVGGQLVTADLAAGLHVDLETAEALKLEHGLCDPALAGAEAAVALPPGGLAGEGGADLAAAGWDGAARAVPERLVAEIVGARAEEILAAVADILRRSGCPRDLPAGVVLTGGGARLRGLAALAMRLLEQPVRVTAPQGCREAGELLGTPPCAAGVGLLQLAAAGLQAAAEAAPAAPARQRRRLRGWWRGLF